MKGWDDQGAFPRSSLQCSCKGMGYNLVPCFPSTIAATSSQTYTNSQCAASTRDGTSAAGSTAGRHFASAARRSLGFTCDTFKLPLRHNSPFRHGSNGGGAWERGNSCVPVGASLSAPRRATPVRHTAPPPPARGKRSPRASAPPPASPPANELTQRGGAGPPW